MPMSPVPSALLAPATPTPGLLTPVPSTQTPLTPDTTAPGPSTATVMTPVMARKPSVVVVTPFLVVDDLELSARKARYNRI